MCSALLQESHIETAPNLVLHQKGAENLLHFALGHLGARQPRGAILDDPCGWPLRNREERFWIGPNMIVYSKGLQNEFFNLLFFVL